jgi:hypothetical protein
VRRRGGPSADAAGRFQPGLAARVRCANGARYFVKAVSAQANPDTPRLHRQEGRVLAALEPVISSRQLPIPRLHGMVDHPPWVALVLQDVAGRQPQLPWQAAELQQVVAAVDQLAQALTPAPVPVPAVSERLGAEFTGWRTLATSAAGDRLDPWSRTHLQEGWWRIFRKTALAGQSFADPDEIAHATQVATAQLNARARPWIWGRPQPKHRSYRRRFIYTL